MGPWWLSQNLPMMQETCVRSLGWEDPLEKGMATHSARRIPWTEEPGGLQSVGCKELDTAQRLNNNNPCLYPKCRCTKAPLHFPCSCDRSNDSRVVWGTWHACKCLQLWQDCSLSISEPWTMCMCGQGVSICCRSPTLSKLEAWGQWETEGDSKFILVVSSLFFSDSCQSLLSSTCLSLPHDYLPC